MCNTISIVTEPISDAGYSDTLVFFAVLRVVFSARSVILKTKMFSLLTLFFLFHSISSLRHSKLVDVDWRLDYKIKVSILSTLYENKQSNVLQYTLFTLMSTLCVLASRLSNFLPVGLRVTSNWHVKEINTCIYYSLNKY